MSDKVKITIELDPFYANNLNGFLTFLIKHHHSYRFSDLDIELLKAVVDGIKVDE